MNLIDLHVVKVLAPPKFEYGKWFVKVRVTAYGRESDSTVLCATESEAKKVKPGYVFQTDSPKYLLSTTKTVA